jgi:hypothetical protein
VRESCEGFTPSAQEECGIEATNPSDTAYLAYSLAGDSAYLADQSSGLVRFSYRGPEGDTLPPPFWLTAPVRPMPARASAPTGTGKPIDALGRALPSASGPALFRLSAPR